MYFVNLSADLFSNFKSYKNILYFDISGYVIVTISFNCVFLHNVCMFMQVAKVIAVARPNSAGAFVSTST